MHHDVAIGRRAPDGPTVCRPTRRPVEADRGRGSCPGGSGCGRPIRFGGPVGAEPAGWISGLGSWLNRCGPIDVELSGGIGLQPNRRRRDSDPSVERRRVNRPRGNTAGREARQERRARDREQHVPHGGGGDVLENHPGSPAGRSWAPTHCGHGGNPECPGQQRPDGKGCEQQHCGIRGCRRCRISVPGQEADDLTRTWQQYGQTGQRHGRTE